MESKKSTTYVYKIEDSAERMDDILDANDNDYEDNKSNIPTRDKLTYKNGYYVDVTALFSPKIRAAAAAPVLAWSSFACAYSNGDTGSFQ